MLIISSISTGSIKGKITTSITFNSRSKITQYANQLQEKASIQWIRCWSKRCEKHCKVNKSLQLRSQPNLAITPLLQVIITRGNIRQAMTGNTTISSKQVSYRKNLRRDHRHTNKAWKTAWSKGAHEISSRQVNLNSIESRMLSNTEAVVCHLLFHQRAIPIITPLRHLAACSQYNRLSCDARRKNCLIQWL